MRDIPEKAKNLSEALRAAAGKLQNRHTTAVIVAGGSGSRMCSDTPKQFMLLEGMPVVVHTLRAYQESSYITDIAVVCREGDEPVYAEFKEKYAIDKLIAVVPGGATRQESVLCGIEACPDKTAYVAIADAARPLTTPEIIRRVCIEAYRYGAATAAFPATDTVKKADKKLFIEETVERSTAWQAATPQIFALNVYRAAAYSCKEEGFAGTDDNSLCEHIGYSVRLVNCGRYNIKITEAEDLAICETLLRLRREKKEAENE